MNHWLSDGDAMDNTGISLEIEESELMGMGEASKKCITPGTEQERVGSVAQSLQNKMQKVISEFRNSPVL